MKSVILSLVLLISLFLGTIVNCRYLNAITDTLLSYESQFPAKQGEKNTPAETIISAGGVWKEAIKRLSYTVHTRYLNAVTTALENVTAYYENGSDSDYQVARLQLREALMALQRADALTLSSVI